MVDCKYFVSYFIYEDFAKLKIVRNKLTLGFNTLRNWRVVNDFKKRMSALNIEVTSDMLGVTIWPYIHNGWDVKKRLDSIATHYEILAKTQSKLTSISTLSSLVIADFEHISPGVTIVIDHAPWFLREGELVINIFQKDLRIASMAFSLTVDTNTNQFGVYIGAVQGIHAGVPAEKSLNIFKDLTKDFQGLRPRTLLLEVLKVMLIKLGIEKIYAVSEEHRHHNHVYFRQEKNLEVKMDYNIFWEEHHGRLINNIGFYEIPKEAAIKDISEIASKKRAQYKRRYAFLESLDDMVKLN